jgi:hypothetical protein
LVAFPAFSWKNFVSYMSYCYQPYVCIVGIDFTIIGGLFFLKNNYLTTRKSIEGHHAKRKKEEKPKPEE